MGSTERVRVCTPALPFFCLLAIALCGGCASTLAPSGWLGTADEAARSGFGGWVAVEFANPQPPSDPPAFGEYVSHADIPVRKRSDAVMVHDFTIPSGAKLYLSGDHGRWYRVQYRNWQGWIEHDELRNLRVRTLAGECIAATGDTLYVLTGTHLHAVAAVDIRRAVVSAFDPHAEILGYWTVLGTVSTITNGFFLIITAPAWVLAGTISTAAQTWEGKLFYPSEPLSMFSLYARFPQGLPPEARDAQMVMKGAVR